jgi:hypothetical protein
MLSYQFLEHVYDEFLGDFFSKLDYRVFESARQIDSLFCWDSHTILGKSAYFSLVIIVIVQLQEV